MQTNMTAYAAPRVIRYATTVAMLVLLPVLSFAQDGWTRYSKDNGLVADLFRRVVIDQQGNLWAATYGKGVYRFDGTSWVLFTKADGLHSNITLDMMVSHDGKIWLVNSAISGDGLSVFDGTNWNVIPLPNEILCLAEDLNHRILVGTGYESDEFQMKNMREIDHPGGYYVVEGDNWTFCPADSFRIQTTITKITQIFVDHNGVVWLGARTKKAAGDGLLSRNQVGSRRGCLIKLQDSIYSKIESAKMAELGQNLYINCINESPSGQLWVGAGCFTAPLLKHVGGLFCLVDDKGNTAPGPYPLSDPFIESMFWDSSGNFWVGTALGINRLDIQGWSALQLGGISMGTNIVNDIVEANKGLLWIATEHGLFRFDSKSNSTKNE
jgi:ligand-binding sensor domain-containing protein